MVGKGHSHVYNEKSWNVIFHHTMGFIISHCTSEKAHHHIDLPCTRMFHKMQFKMLRLLCSLEITLQFHHCVVLIDSLDLWKYIAIWVNSFHVGFAWGMPSLQKVPLGFDKVVKSFVAILRAPLLSLFPSVRKILSTGATITYK